LELLSFVSSHDPGVRGMQGIIESRDHATAKGLSRQLRFSEPPAAKLQVAGKLLLDGPLLPHLAGTSRQIACISPDRLYNRHGNSPLSGAVA
jgi:hypothetical protein